MYLGNGKVGHARSSEGNSCAGDQSGNEIRIQSYWNYPWDCVLRYPEATNNCINTNTEQSNFSESAANTSPYITISANTLDLFDMVMEFEEEFGIEIPSEDLEGITTVGALLSYIESKQA